MRRALALAALVLGVALTLAGVGNDPLAVDLDLTFARPSLAHPFGTDHLGRDLAARITAGAVPTLLAVSVALVASLGIGAAAGAAMALGPGAPRAIIGRAAETALAIPTFVAALLVAAVLGPGPIAIGVAIGVSTWAPYALTVQALTERVIAQDYWRAAVALGVGPYAGFRRHLLPALAPPLGALAGADAGRALMLSASLGFLGLAGDTGRPDWGGLALEYRMLMFQAPRLFLMPVAAIACLSLGAHLLLDRDGPGASIRRVVSRRGGGDRRPRSATRSSRRRAAE